MKRQKITDSKIYKHTNGVYYFRSGDFEKSLKTKDKRQAKINAQGLEAKIDEFGVSAYRLKVSSVLPEYFEFRQSQTLGKSAIRQSTVDECKKLFKLHLEPFFGDLVFASINESKWLDYCQFKNDIDLMNHRKVFSYFLKWAKVRGYYNYTLDMKIPKSDRRERPIHPPEVCKKIIENSKGSLRLFLSMYLFMGMRRSEIMKLSWDRVSLERGLLVLGKGDTKTKKRRYVTINPFVLQLLQNRFKEQSGQSLWVFQNAKHPEKHADPSGLKTAWKTLLKKCGFLDLDIQWHDLRATHQYYSHKSTDFTDTQREKFSGSNIEVQKRHYVSFEADDVRGLESVVKFDGLDQVLEKALDDELGKTREKQKLLEP